MQFKKSKEIYVTPIIFIILFVAATILMGVYLKDNEPSVIIVGIMVPVILLILDIAYVIYILTVKNILIEVDSTILKCKDMEIPLQDISYTAVRKDIFSTYHPFLLIVLKNDEKIKIRMLNDAYEASKIINKKYLNLKGNWVR